MLLPQTTAGTGTHSLREDQGLPIKNATTSTSGMYMYVYMYILVWWASVALGLAYNGCSSCAGALDYHQWV